jgi:hypothetical protein
MSDRMTEESASSSSGAFCTSFVRSNEILTDNTMVTGPNYTDGPAISLMKGQMNRRGFGNHTMSKRTRRTMQGPMPPMAKTPYQALFESFPIVTNLMHIKQLECGTKSLFECCVELQVNNCDIFQF